MYVCLSCHLLFCPRYAVVTKEVGFNRLFTLNAVIDGRLCARVSGVDEDNLGARFQCCLANPLAVILDGS